MTIGDQIASQPTPMEFTDPDARFPSFMGGGGDAMEQGEEMEERPSDGEEEALQDVQALFRENLIIPNI